MAEDGKESPLEGFAAWWQGGEDPRSSRYNRVNALTDLVFVALIAVTLFLVGVVFDAPSRVAAWADATGFPLAEFLILVTVLAVGFVIVAVRRWQELTETLRERDRLDQELRRSYAELEATVRNLERSNEELEQFAYVASHDLREPLRMVKGYLTLVDRRFGETLDDEGREFIDLAVDGADRMDRLIQDLLEYSRVDQTELETEQVDLGRLMDEVTSNLKFAIDETSATVEWDDLPMVEGEPDLLRQVFQNLVHNAIKFHGEEPPLVEVTAERDGDAWQVAVEDNGMGIPPEDRHRIFMIFRRLHGAGDIGGTGIGLATCKKIVERHGGEIWVESEEGAGSTFYFTVPEEATSSSAEGAAVPAG